MRGITMGIMARRRQAQTLKKLKAQKPQSSKPAQTPAKDVKTKKQGARNESYSTGKI